MFLGFNSLLSQQAAGNLTQERLNKQNEATTTIRQSTIVIRLSKGKPNCLR
jgi:fibronectin type 3 domain-containing protein